MNVMVFLVISLIVHCLPIPFTRDMLDPGNLLKWLPLRLVWGTAAWTFITILLMQTLPWAILTLVMSFGMLLIVNSGVRINRIENFAEGLQVPLVCTGILILILMPVFSGVIAWTSDVANAQFFDERIEVTDDPLFNSTIPDDMVRLVTEEYAMHVAKQHIGPFGSDVVVSAAHITTNSTGRLKWVCTITSTNVLAQNYVLGFIIVDANNPQGEKPQIITSTTIPVGEGLFWDRDIRFGNYLNDMTSAYEYAYPTWDPAGNLVYIQTRTPLGFDFVERASGPIVYAENGSIRAYDSIEETPSWITQTYSEEWLERQISRWGGYRRGETFDLFSGGFLWLVPPSNDRLEITEDTRYIVNPDTMVVEAFIAVHPVTNSRALAGVFRATQDAVYYHDLSNYGYVSGDAAAANVVSQLPPPANGFYYGAMPLLYPVSIGTGQIKWTWYAPIYWADGYYDEDNEEFYLSDMRLHALAMVDASNIDKFYIQQVYEQSSGITVTGRELVYAARVGFVESFGGTVEPERTGIFELTADVVNKTSYIYGGNEYIVFGTNNETYPYITAMYDWVNETHWFTVLNLHEGDNFTATIEHIGEQYRIIAIVKN